jgi:hypothetical protein
VPLLVELFVVEEEEVDDEAEEDVVVDDDDDDEDDDEPDDEFGRVFDLCNAAINTKCVILQSNTA